jgi:class I fructose-bisphosphate aldolase/fructose-bisphosphate aldolase/6-deoxy-5-ketofructose 1-phosphate synthase
MKNVEEIAGGLMPLPADVPSDQVDTFRDRFTRATGGTGRLMLFAGDQKLEHLNKDFWGEGISADDANPVHLFQIASRATIGVFATQLGLISRFSGQFPGIPFLVKLNSKTNLVPFTQNDPLSRAWFSVDQVVDFARTSGIELLGVGYTVYLGSDYEAKMLTEAARIVHDAHLNGLFTVLWMYPKGKAVQDEHDVQLIAGAAGAGACLGSDFVKLKVPMENKQPKPELLAHVVAAAGNTGVLCEGGSREDARVFLEELHAQIHQGGTRGSGTGRNIHQHELDDAIKMANAIYSVTVGGKTAADALTILEGSTIGPQR